MTRDRRIISGRVPTMVITFRGATSHLLGHGVRAVTIENLVRPEQGYQGAMADVGDVVRPAGNGLDHHRHGARGPDLVSFAGEDVTEAEPGLAFDDQELLRLCLV